ncbi:MAG TPA: 23S rRNA (pseudouridine(1915)-N(3))-methyltransferase RlmH [Bacilli bacterium]|nr:23S rRNA (pseudouridine(1915)-N(3))-methyltransferase RlmH [Bacilli bacterium]
MIKIIWVGKLKEKYLEDLVKDYLTRIKKYHKIEVIAIKDSNLDLESKKIIASLKTKDFNILLDINGENLSSVEFSDLISDTFNHYGTITFIIGGSNGVSDEVKDLVNKKISFSQLTFPHGLFRGILLEQIYRSFKIINNEKYHK